MEILLYKGKLFFYFYINIIIYIIIYIKDNS